jgi:hypothetical protein
MIKRLLPLPIPPESAINASGAQEGQVLAYSTTLHKFVPVTPASGPGGSPAWGSITGTLAAQTDLAGALNGKATEGHVHSGIYSPVGHGHGASEIAGTAIVEGDSRLTNPRTPTAHGHGPSEITGTAVVTADSRLSDARTPTAHGHAQSEITGLVTSLAAKAASDHLHPGIYDADGAAAAAIAAHNSTFSHSLLHSNSLDHARQHVITAAADHTFPGGTTDFLRADGTFAAPPTGQGGTTPEQSYFRHYGVTTYEAWFTSPRTGTALVGTALVGARFYAMPFICPKAITLDRIGVYVSTLSTGNARLGIYSDNGNIYPGARLLDAGEISVISTGAKILTINQALAAGTLYWLVILCAATPAINCFPVAAVINVLGTSNALGATPNCGLYASQAYGALPATFPAFVSMIAAAPIPAIFVRLSA